MHGNSLDGMGLDTQLELEYTVLRHQDPALDNYVEDVSSTMDWLTFFPLLQPLQERTQCLLGHCLANFVS